MNEELKRVITSVKSSPGNHQVKGKQIYSRPPNEADDDPIIQALQKAAGNQSYSGMSYWADSALASQAGIPSVLFGPAGHGAHAIDEWVSKKSMISCFEAMKKFILGFED